MAKYDPLYSYGEAKLVQSYGTRIGPRYNYGECEVWFEYVEPPESLLGDEDPEVISHTSILLFEDDKDVLEVSEETPELIGVSITAVLELTGETPLLEVTHETPWWEITGETP